MKEEMKKKENMKEKGREKEMKENRIGREHGETQVG